MHKPRKILITGAAGQIGTELVVLLRKKYGNEAVVGCGRTTRLSAAVERDFPGPFLTGIDVCNQCDLERVWQMHPDIDTIVHLAGMLSAGSERAPRQAWKINCEGTLNVLDCALKFHVKRVLFTSSIAAFGTAAGPLAAQGAILNPSSMYGVTKVSMETCCEYYRMRHGLDVVGLRLPGTMSAYALPGRGSTSYATEMFYAALQGREYECYLTADTRLPLLFMPDAVEGIATLLTADSSGFTNCSHSNYNVRGFVLSPKLLAQSIRRHFPDFRVRYQSEPLRQSIADSWPDDMDDSVAKLDWGWDPRFGVDEMVDEMFRVMRLRFDQTGSFYPSVSKPDGKLKPSKSKL